MTNRLGREMCTEEEKAEVTFVNIDRGSRHPPSMLHILGLDSI